MPSTLSLNDLSLAVLFVTSEKITCCLVGFVGFCLFVFFVLFCFVFCFFQDKVSLWGPGCPGTHSVDQAGLERRNLPASASQVLRLQACTTTAWLVFS